MALTNKTETYFHSRIETMANQTLITLEAEIEAGIRSVGSSLLKIQEQRLYKDGYSDFETYCQERWNFSKPRAYQLIEAEKVKARLSTLVDVLPTKERHLREIAKIPEKKQAAAVAEVYEKCELEDREPTAKDFRAAAKPFLPPKEKQTELIPKPEPQPKAETVSPLVQILKWIKSGEVSRDAVQRILDAFEPTDEQLNIGFELDEFEQFWRSYPAKGRTGKKAAQKSWGITVRSVDPARVIAAAAEFSLSPKASTEFVPAASVWLNQGRWDDDREAWNRGGTIKDSSADDVVKNWKPPEGR